MLQHLVSKKRCQLALLRSSRIMAFFPANFLNSRCQFIFNAAGQMTRHGYAFAIVTVPIACNVFPSPGWSPNMHRLCCSA